MSSEHAGKKPKVSKTDHGLAFFSPWSFSSFADDHTQALAQSHKESQKFNDAMSTHQNRVDAINAFCMPAKKQLGTYADYEGQLEAIAGFSKGSSREHGIRPTQGSFSKALKEYDALFTPLSSDKKKLYELGGFESPWKTESKYLDDHKRMLELFGASSKRQPIDDFTRPRSQSLVEAQSTKSQRHVSIHREQTATSGQRSKRAAESKAPELVVLKPSPTPNPGIETNQLLRKILQVAETDSKRHEQIEEEVKVLKKEISQISAELSASRKEIQDLKDFKDIINPIHQNLATIADLAVSIRIAIGGSPFPEFQQLSPDEQDYLDDSAN